MKANYIFPSPNSQAARLTLGWLLLGLGALIAAGIYSILLVSSRTPGIEALIPWIDFFHTALIVHVDLSVLIWFLGYAALIWSYTNPPGSMRLDWLALLLCSIGAGVIALSPFLASGPPLINNYVPILQQPVFFSGLALFGIGFLLRTLTRLWSGPRQHSEFDSPLFHGAYTAALTALLALLYLPLSWWLMNPVGDSVGFHEVLFWAAGHEIQYTHTLLLMLSWLWLTQATGTPVLGRPHWIAAGFWLLALPALISPLFFLQANPSSGQFRLDFTHMMVYGGLTSVPLGLVVVVSLARQRVSLAAERPARAALLCSIFLFAAGGILGFMIQGVNVVIPAHYHGSIVGVTLGFMGLSYHLLPRLGYPLVTPRLARWQAYIYAGGQLLHITGLAWSGGYGVQRKTAGAAQGLDRLPEILGMGMMGLGGLIAIIGGLLFLVVCLRALWSGRGRNGRTLQEPGPDHDTGIVIQQ